MMNLRYKTVIALFLLLSSAVSQAQQFDAPVAFPEFLEIQRESSGHVAAFQDTVSQYNNISERIGGLGDVPDTEARLRAAAGIVMELEPLTKTISGQIDALEASLDDLAIRYARDAKAIPGNDATLLRQQQQLEDLLRQKETLDSLDMLSDENYQHIAAVSQLGAALSAMTDSTDFAGAPTNASQITAYFNRRVRDLQMMVLSLDIVKATSAHITGLLSKRAEQEGMAIAATSVPQTPIQVREMLKATKNALLISDEQLNKPKVRRGSGNPFVVEE